MNIKTESALNLTFYDLITHLVPGVLLVLLIFITTETDLDLSSEVLVLLILVLGYVTGHFLLIIGNVLYNSFFHPKNYKKGSFIRFLICALHKLTEILIRQNYKTPRTDMFRDKAKALIKDKLGIDNLNDIGVYEICDSLAVESDSSERVNLFAKQGFYRATSSLILIVSVRYLVFGNSSFFSLILILFIFAISNRLLLLAHTYYGNIRRLQTYFLAYKKLLEM